MRRMLLMLLLPLLAGSAFSQSAENIISISLTKQNRGFLDEVIISRDSVQGFSENHRVPENAQQYASGLDQDEWARLMFALKDISLEDIDGLQSPSSNRAHDGAIHSTITITLDDGRVITHSFDDENPHPDLQPLLDIILEHRLPGN